MWGWISFPGRIEGRSKGIGTAATFTLAVAPPSSTDSKEAGQWPIAPFPHWPPEVRHMWVAILRAVGRGREYVGTFAVNLPRNTATHSVRSLLLLQAYCDLHDIISRHFWCWTNDLNHDTVGWGAVPFYPFRNPHPTRGRSSCIE